MEKSSQNTLQIAPFTNIIRELACLQTHLAGTVHDYNLSLFLLFLSKIVTKHLKNSPYWGHTKKIPGSMLSNPPAIAWL